MRKLFQEINVKIPASIANLGPGFDVFAIAISNLYDVVSIKRTSKRKIELEVSGLKASSIPKKLEENTAGVVAQKLAEEFSLKDGFRIHLRKGIPHSIGLGSSGASAVGAAYAIDRLYGLNLSNTELISFASQGEAALSGSAHFDNVSASLLGGFVLIQSYNPIKVHRISPPKNLEICVIIPKVRVPERKTAFARKILPTNVDLRHLTYNVGHASSFAYGMATGRIDIIRESISDAVIEGIRSKLIPGYENVKDCAKKLNTNIAICGGGPSIVALLDREKEDANFILKTLKEAFENVGIRAGGFITRPNQSIKIISSH